MSSEPRLPDSVRRGLRTFLQAFLATFGALVISGQFTVDVNGAQVPDWGTWDTLIMACILSGIVASASWLWNVLEDQAGSDGFVVKK